MFLLVLLSGLLVSPVFPLSTPKCPQGELVRVITSFSSCTSGVMSSSLDQNGEINTEQKCRLIDEKGPMFQCALDHLGSCFTEQEVGHIKMTGPIMRNLFCNITASHLPVDETKFFPWLTLPLTSPCTKDLLDQLNTDLQSCLTDQDMQDQVGNILGKYPDVINNDADKEKAKTESVAAILVCADKILTSLPCLASPDIPERSPEISEISLLRSQYKTALDQIMCEMLHVQGCGHQDIVPRVAPPGAALSSGDKNVLSHVVFTVLSLLGMMRST